jgi:dolichyldiphosphatase
MPSTHSSSIAFFGTYLSLCIARLKPHPRFLPHLLSRSGDTEDFSLPIRVLLTGGVLYGAGSVCWSRVRLTYHTPAQVLAGVAVGSSLAVLSFVVWQQRVAQVAPLVEGTVEELLLVALDSWHSGSIGPLQDSLCALWREWAPPLKAAAAGAQPGSIVELR